MFADWSCTVLVYLRTYCGKYRISKVSIEFCNSLISGYYKPYILLCQLGRFKIFKSCTIQLQRYKVFSFVVSFVTFKHRLIKKTDRTLNVVFLRFMCFSFTITLSQEPKRVTRSRRRTGSLSVELEYRERVCFTTTTLNSFGLLPRGYCERKPINHLVSYLLF